jgi:hypothetical protein
MADSMAKPARRDVNQPPDSVSSKPDHRLGGFLVLDISDDHAQFAIAVFFAKVGFRLRYGCFRCGYEELLNLGNRLPIEAAYEPRLFGARSGVHEEETVRGTVFVVAPFSWLVRQDGQIRAGYLAGQISEDALLKMTVHQRFFVANAHDTVGMVCLATGRVGDAREHFEKAITPIAFESFNYAWAKAYLAHLDADSDHP